MTQHQWGRPTRLYNLDKEDYLEVRQRCRECGAVRVVYAGAWEKAPVGHSPASVLQIEESVTLALLPVVYPN